MQVGLNLPAHFQWRPKTAIYHKYKENWYLSTQYLTDVKSLLEVLGSVPNAPKLYSGYYSVLMHSNFFSNADSMGFKMGKLARNLRQVSSDEHFYH